MIDCWQNEPKVYDLGLVERPLPLTFFWTFPHRVSPFSYESWNTGSCFLFSSFIKEANIFPLLGTTLTLSCKANWFILVLIKTVRLIIKNPKRVQITIMQNLNFGGNIWLIYDNNISGTHFVVVMIARSLDDVWNASTLVRGSATWTVAPDIPWQA